jgi:hypothetical protein
MRFFAFPRQPDALAWLGAALVKARELVRLLVLAGVLLALGSPAGALAQQVGSDAAAKVRLTIALSRFVQWPDTAANEPRQLQLCVLHQSDLVGAAFTTMDGSTLNGQRVTVQLNPRLDWSQCQLLFVDDSAARTAATALAAVRDKPVLTLGAFDGFLAAGGMIELVNVNDMLRFDVDLVPLRTARLLLHASALKLARRVRS